MSNKEIVENLGQMLIDSVIEAEDVEEAKKELIRKTQEALEGGISPQEILKEGFGAGLEVLGKGFEEGEIFLPELLNAGQIIQAIVNDVMAPYFGEAKYKEGTIVIGTVKGDIHTIGKDLVRLLLRANGFEVFDLGIEVDAEKFIATAKKHEAQIIAMSALLTTTMTYMSVVVEERNLKLPEVKIMIGGAPVTRSFANEIGAEGYAPDCFRAVGEAKRLISLK